MFRFNVFNCKKVHAKTLCEVKISWNGKNALGFLFNTCNVKITKIKRTKMKKTNMKRTKRNKKV